MAEVTRKEQETFENLLRRFNRKVQQNGILPIARKKQYFTKPLSKKEQREIAIRKRAKKEAKLKQIIRGF
ncbi:TPA: 30S ribosomal protein S21 [candidate division CPR2 bacterium]|uniref:Small ribosomal subunit protein bS21 n=1 Tax=candidate division CPR2 bacterium GW2011_GWC1_41_48 TaxID=1618344 RepID=A0A0G0YJF8_UNCC2|nr:MAG: hypothetical protein UT47_C0001G0056 [candidate division CPR2 bacterium GW2011_GWC2_39_35]KKR29496.1 MAG: hypothetical protein UT60_C0001G0032 [candidate division CPR2 bacterium GW2011_GWD2_39_7]KKR29721.1 MAG: hypothetical protein UT59_C0001G0030 [candidate division CPR2 bacterium GW2011_GWD1_39_7]KKS09651.1 MAG: hypothetical protein UU65_C0001G0056 [candidate division CPR2 bacterium GW2011_GWC1_41_48]OGB59506.1 MAG: 30S ribosomal protein S21 [candidate division CPR2 bacterium GWD1_39_